MSALGLSQVATSLLNKLRQMVEHKQLSLPLDADSLHGFAGEEAQQALLVVLAGHSRQAVLAVLDATLAERAVRKYAPELVWTGPEGPGGQARDTAIVLRELFEGARQSVILAGYAFDHARDVLEPLHRAMVNHQVEARFFVDIPQREQGSLPAIEYLQAHLGSFLHNNWPFGAPLPRLYYDKRALNPGPPYCSLHAKCVVVDGTRAFVSSANFTQRGQERNIEVGVLIDDVRFAETLAGQWLGLVGNGLVVEWVVG
jgi:hypothetical protein